MAWRMLRGSFLGLFTLIELLVVVAIVGVLIALLMPALGNARQLAKMINCSSNLKQFHVAIICYVNDWKGYPPYIGPGPAPFFVNYMEGFYPYVSREDWPSNKFIPVLNCPSNKETPVANRLYSTYGLGFLWAGYGGGGDYCSITQLKRPSVTPLAADMQGSTGGTMTFSGHITYTNRAPHIFRHGSPDYQVSRAVYAYCDGHVKPCLYKEAYLGLYPLVSYDTWRPR